MIAIEQPDPAHLARMRTVLEAATEEVEGIIASKVHDALALNNSPYTLVWETTFADQAAIDRYRDHRIPHRSDTRSVHADQVPDGDRFHGELVRGRRRCRVKGAA